MNIKIPNMNSIPNSLAIVGKNETLNFKIAQKLAQKLLCEKNIDDCNCGPCSRVTKNISESVLIVKPENQIIKIESSKQIMNFIKLVPINKSNIVIIQNANLMNKEASNHLLKAIEEPSKYQYFMLLAPEERTLLSTIRSRVQIFRSEAISKLSNNFNLDNKNLSADDLVFEKSLDMLDAIIKNSISNVSKIKIKDRKEALLICYLIREFLRDLAFVYYDKALVKYPDIIKKYSFVKLDRINSMFDSSSKMIRYLKGNVDRNIIFEQMIIGRDG